MLTFSEALEQYLDARDKIVALRDWWDADAISQRTNAYAAQKEAAARMDELMPGKS